MNLMDMVQSAFRGPWGCIAVSGTIVLVILVFSFVPRAAKAQGGGPVAEVSSSVLAQARQLVQDGKPLVAVKLLSDTARVPLVEAQAYVKAVQSAQQASLSFTEALTVALACEVKTLVAQAQREQAVQLLVSRAGAPQAEAQRLVEMLGSSKDHREWLSRRPLPGAPPGVDLQQVRALAAEGKKVEAIALYRKLTSASLDEAKQYVDSL